LTLFRVLTAFIDVFAIDQAVTVSVQSVPTSHIIRVYLDAGQVVIVTC
jgi:hypothetical protein